MIGIAILITGTCLIISSTLVLSLFLSDQITLIKTLEDKKNDVQKEIVYFQSINTRCLEMEHLSDIVGTIVLYNVDKKPTHEILIASTMSLNAIGSNREKKLIKELKNASMKSQEAINLALNYISTNIGYQLYEMHQAAFGHLPSTAEHQEYKQILSKAKMSGDFKKVQDKISELRFIWTKRNNSVLVPKRDKLDHDLTNAYADEKRIRNLAILLQISGTVCLLAADIVEKFLMS